MGSSDEKKKATYKPKSTSSKYKIMYQNYISMKGGDLTSKDNLKWSNQTSFDTYNNLVAKIGEPNKVCVNSDDIVEYVIWQDDYSNVQTHVTNRIGGLDYLKLTNHHAKKWHPKPANVFIIAGKYMTVPDHLLGPIKFASETINVEQLFVEKSSNDNFGQSGVKDKVLVTGSCASIDISTVTVAFVEKMIQLHKDNFNVNMELHNEFKNEYDNVINKYIKTNTYDPISWYKRDMLY
jgi:hypothetical protein